MYSTEKCANQVACIRLMMSQDSDPVVNLHREVKVVVVGDGAVGKTCLCNVFTKGIFETPYPSGCFYETPVKQMNVAGQVKIILIVTFFKPVSNDSSSRLVWGFPNTLTQQ